jgi:hypothetical protein
MCSDNKVKGRKTHLPPHWQCPKQVLDGHCGAYATCTRAAAGEFAIAIKLEPCGSSLKAAAAAAAKGSGV